MRRNTFSYRISGVIGALAQLVEQRPEEPCVPSSSLGGATIDNSNHLRAPWRSGYAEVCKTFYTGSIPVGASSTFIVYYWASGGIGIRGGLKIRWFHDLVGSSPTLPTINT